MPRGDAELFVAFGDQNSTAEGANGNPSAVMRCATCLNLRVGDAGFRTYWLPDEPESLDPLDPESLWPVAGDPLCSCIGCAVGEP